jgi:hypothetical protein
VKHNPDRDIWEPLSVPQVASLLEHCSSRWWLSGGWAVDHWLGPTTRDHGDIDISTLRADLAGVLAVLPARLRPAAAMNGHLLPLAEHLDDTALHNIWLRDEETDRWVLQVNLEDGDQTSWRYRRDPGICLPWTSAVRVTRSVPTGTPATQLLWKSKAPRPQDEHDLDAAHSALSAGSRRWLRDAVRTAHPRSPWLGDPRLADPI